MNFIYVIICGILFVSQSIYSQIIYPGQVDSSFVPQRSHHYDPELLFDICVNETAWDNQNGMHVSFGSTDQLYFRKEVPFTDNKDLSYEYEMTAWRGERVNAQLLVWSSDLLEQVRVIPGDFRNDEGDIISKDCVSLNLIRYVLSNYPYADKQAVCGESPYKAGFLMPDRFEVFERFDLPNKTMRPIWVSVNVPKDSKPGNYKSEIEIRSKGGVSKSVCLKLKVQNHVLPDPKDWKYRLDLWQNPWAVAWYNHLEPWSDEHKKLLKQHLKNYADAGGKYITTYGVHSPWSDNSYMIEGGMIEWIKQIDGEWRFDYQIFDEYVSLAMSCGIDKAITIYTAIPWGNRFRYLDEKSGDYIYVSWAPESNEFKKMWNIFLTDLKFHLETKGWLDITYIGINENPLEQTLEAIKTIKSHDKCWRITYAGDWHEELNLLLDDYSFLFGKEPTIEQQKNRSLRGLTSTVYVCCNPPVPNNFVFSPPVEGRWISWYVMAYGYDGFLRWAYDAWPEDPMRDARHGSWAAGDCFMVYPGGNSCIRFEKMREGIVDFEKVYLLKNWAKMSENKEALMKLDQLDELLSIFPKEEKFEERNLSENIKRGLVLINEISDLLQ